MYKASIYQPPLSLTVCLVDVEITNLYSHDEVPAAPVIPSKYIITFKAPTSLLLAPVLGQDGSPY